MNYQPDEASVRAKLARTGSLFASDEVAVLIAEIDRLRLSVPAAPPPQEGEPQLTDASTWAECKRIVDWHRDMALRFAEDRDALKHECRALKNEIAALKSVAPPPQEPPPLCSGCGELMQRVEYRCGPCGTYRAQAQPQEKS